MGLSFSPLKFYCLNPLGCDPLEPASLRFCSLLNRLAFLHRASGCGLGWQIHPTVTKTGPSPAATPGSWQVSLLWTSSLAIPSLPRWEVSTTGLSLSLHNQLSSAGAMALASSPFPRKSPWLLSYQPPAPLPTLIFAILEGCSESHPDPECICTCSCALGVLWQTSRF